MDEKKFTTDQVKDLVSKSNSIAVIINKNATLDAFCSAAGLYYQLKDLNKDVKLIFDGKIPEKAQKLISEDEITTDIFYRDLVVSIDYSGTKASKANYTTFGNTLRLTLGPVPKTFDLSKVHASVEGHSFDLAFILGTEKLLDLGQIYLSLKEEMEKAKIINVDNSKKNERFGTINVLDTNSDSVSLLVLNKSVGWGLQQSKKSATALLYGINSN